MMALQENVVTLGEPIGQKQTSSGKMWSARRRGEGAHCSVHMVLGDGGFGDQSKGKTKESDTDAAGTKDSREIAAAAPDQSCMRRGGTWLQSGRKWKM